MKLPFVGPSYDLESRPSGVQRTVNMFPIPVEPGNERSSWVLKDAPGLEAWSLDPGLVPDPLFDDVILLMQRGLFVDTSSYARSVAQATGASVLVDQAQPSFPSGKSIRINGAHNNRGIQYGMGPEMNLNTRARCFEAIVLLDVGAHGGGAQIFYNDGFGFGGTVWFARTTDGNLGLRVDGPEIYANVAYYVPENIPYYIGCQIPTGPTGPDNLPSFWAAPLTDPTVTLRASLASVARPVLDVGQFPYTGYVGGSGGVNAYQIDMMRITNGVRYTPGQTIPVPTLLWPEFGP